ncbi:MAG: hypothetical protein V3T70_06085 [Phycisphaerae bacterium]
MNDDRQIGDSFPDYYHRAMAIVPGYKELFGVSATFEGLLEIVLKYSLTEWLSYLSRIQTLITPPYAEDPERHAALYKAVIGDRVADRLVAFEKKHDSRSRILTFVEPQVATLQQLVILHAPEGNTATFDCDSGRDDLSVALLMTWELMHASDDPQTADETFASLMQDFSRHPGEAPDTLAGRAFAMYQIDKAKPTPAVAELRRLFRDSTAEELSDYLIGGFSIAVREQHKSVEDTASGWQPIPSQDQCSNPLEARCLAAFHKLRCSEVDDLRFRIKEFDGHRAINDWSLIALLKSPIVELSNKRRFILGLSSLGRALFDGVRHALLTEARPLVDPKKLGALYGGVFEDYVLEILRAAFGDRLIRLPPSDVPGEERADAIVVYPRRVVVLEIKSSHYVGTEHKGLLSIEERVAELGRLGITKGASQIADTIRALRRYGIPGIGLPEYDWTTTTIVPVIVTKEKIPLVWGLRRVYEPLLADILNLPLHDQICPTRFISIADVEGIPDLARRTEFADVLIQWASDTTSQECPLSHYLTRQNMSVTRQHFWKHSVLPMMELLIQHFGLDRAKVPNLDRRP